MTDELPPNTDPKPGHGGPFVPGAFSPPEPPRTASIWLEPLGPQHNDADYAAWMSSIEHIHATPGFPDGDWPHEMTPEENLVDLVMHADHFARSLGFTYTVRSTEDDDVVGCVYMYPLAGDPSAANVSSWVTEARADLDAPLYHAVSEWLERDWPFPRVEYGARD